MNDRTKRESIVNFALKNGIKLPADFRAGDGTYKNSEAAKELAGSLLRLGGCLELELYGGKGEILHNGKVIEQVDLLEDHSHPLTGKVYVKTVLLLHVL